MDRGSAYTSRQVLSLYAGGLLTVVLIALAVSVFPVQLGIARPDASARRAVAALVEVDAALEQPADYVEFSNALLVAHGVYRALPMRNQADNSVGIEVASALDCYDAIREAWQADLQGDWVDAIHGEPAYWRSFHPAAEVPQPGPLGPAQVRETLRAEARAYRDEALAIIER